LSVFRGYMHSVYCMLELQDQKVIYGLSALLKHSFTIIQI